MSTPDTTYKCMVDDMRCHTPSTDLMASRTPCGGKGAMVPVAQHRRISLITASVVEELEHRRDESDDDEASDEGNIDALLVSNLVCVDERTLYVGVVLLLDFLRAREGRPRPGLREMEGGDTFSKGRATSPRFATVQVSESKNSEVCA